MPWPTLSAVGISAWDQFELFLDTQGVHDKGHALFAPQQPSHRYAQAAPAAPASSISSISALVCRLLLGRRRRRHRTGGNGSSSIATIGGLPSSSSRAVHARGGLPCVAQRSLGRAGCPSSCATVKVCASVEELFPKTIYTYDRAGRSLSSAECVVCQSAQISAKCFCGLPWRGVCVCVVRKSIAATRRGINRNI